MKKTTFLTAVLATLVYTLSFLPSAHAIVELFDGKLKLNGNIKESILYRTQMDAEAKKYHDCSMDYDVTSGLLEALYTFKEDENGALRAYAGFKYWWDKAPMYDDKLHHNIYKTERKDYVRPRNFDDDVLTEAYIDYINGPLQVKVGKQIVIWGQLDIQRVADVVNPLDLRKGAPGIDSWEEVKRGIWMIRSIYKSQLPGDLQFEGIFNPGDYRGMELAYEGTHYGSEHAPNNPFKPGPAFGIFSWQQQKWRQDMPGWALKNYELGFRLTGYTWDTDWTLLAWNALDDGPVANPRHATPYMLEYIEAGIFSEILGRGINPPPAKAFHQRVWQYKRYTTFGGTAQRVVKPLWDSVWRLEWYYEKSRPLDLGTGGDKAAVYDWTRRSVVGGAVQCSKDIRIPGFTDSIIANSALTTVAFTFFYEKIPHFSNDLVVDDRNHQAGHSSTQQLILYVQQSLFQGSFMFIFTGNYYLHVAKWMAVPALSYMFPGKHWRLDLGYAAYGVGRKDYLVRTTDRKDSIITRLRYEF